MLVLTRKMDEMIQIGDSIVIKVISTGRGKVKLGIDAPKDVRVLRGVQPAGTGVCQTGQQRQQG
ncbi:MAG: carbon storage regulator [Planctomycetaceae bacterium]